MGSEIYFGPSLFVRSVRWPNGFASESRDNRSQREKKKSEKIKSNSGGMDGTITEKERKEHGKTPTPVNSIQFRAQCSRDWLSIAHGRLFYKCSRLGGTPPEFEYNELFWIFIDARLPARLKCKFPRQLNVSHTIPRSRCIRMCVTANGRSRSSWTEIQFEIDYTVKASIIWKLHSNSLSFGHYLLSFPKNTQIWITLYLQRT